MSGKKTTLEPHISLNQNFITFSDIVNEYMKCKEYTQADLMRESNLPKTTISRICRNSNDKGSTYQPTPNTVAAICIGLRPLKGEEIKALIYAAFPEFSIWKEAIEKNYDIDDTNHILYENGFSTLGNDDE